MNYWAKYLKGQMNYHQLIVTCSIFTTHTFPIIFVKKDPHHAYSYKEKRAIANTTDMYTYISIKIRTVVPYDQRKLKASDESERSFSWWSLKRASILSLLQLAWIFHLQEMYPETDRELLLPAKITLLLGITENIYITLRWNFKYTKHYKSTC